MPQQQRIPKILIISSDTGGGHRSAAAAIVAGVQKFFEGESYAIRVVRAVEESHHLSAKLVRLYNWILRNRQHWMKYYYWFINYIRPEKSAFFAKRCIPYVAGLFERWCPHIDVSVPADQAEARVAAALKAGGRLADGTHAPHWWTLASPENHGVDIAAWPDFEDDEDD